MKLSNESYFSLNFIARKRANKEGELPITLRITMNGQRAEIYVNRTVRPDDWNAAKGQSNFTYFSPPCFRLISTIFSRSSDFINCPYIGCPKKLLLLLMVIHGLFGDTKITN